MAANLSKHASLSLAEESRAKSRAARLSILTAAFLIALKTATGWLTGSISVWASLLDSTMDIFASAINYVAVRTAARPADEDHAYGHGKAESLAGLFQASIITLSGLFLIIEAIRRLIIPHSIAATSFGIVAMLIATLVSALLVTRLRRVARATESPALQADALHYLTDIWTNLGALLALIIVVRTGWLIADPLISLAISLYIIWSAVRVGRDSVDVLMDRRLPLEIDDKIAAIVERYRDEGVRGFHDLRTRRSGSVKFIDLHLEIDRHKRLDEAHEITVKVLRAIEEEIPRSHVQIHTDPV
ncbi:cation diffusion facilitator family transporter [Pyrinomonas methylaliphatogenes]|jgi:ferrous-iron efflux pump FieF|uniref:Cation diffusion facilitator family transporter n=1 Tax=Pyrinomonas methylaliphatogenes TaxID=454194 RepID=A0A0B6WXT7_9BACT|nr:cation diffusion facilitator family transporter [Pyrinomonas methylaliphatogenes]MBX5478128.1 cation transporter [Pyrinomonas methylaliphatogenes]CDM64985.1 cation diffusion facilitator family transporter [Pyrinomonas methylaliphatogenes]